MNYFSPIPLIKKLLVSTGIILLCSNIIYSENVIVEKNEIINILDAYMITDKGVVLWCEGRNHLGEVVFGVIFQKYRDYKIYTWWGLNDLSMLEQRSIIPSGYTVDIPIISQKSKKGNNFFTEKNESSDTEEAYFSPYGKKVIFYDDMMSKIDDDICFCLVAIGVESDKDPFWGIAKSLDSGQSWSLLIFWNESATTMDPKDCHFFANGDGIIYFHIVGGGEVFYFFIDDFLYIKEFNDQTIKK